MRLVIVTHAYPRWSGDLPGSFLGRLAATLVARGHVVSVVAPSDHGRGGREQRSGVEILRVRYAAPDREDLTYSGDMARQARTLSGAWAFRGLLRAMRAGTRSEAQRIGADLVHAFWWVPGGWTVTGLGYPTVVSLTGTDVGLMASLPARLLARRVLTRAGRVTALSTFLAMEARRCLGLPDLVIDRVPVPADVDRFRRQDSGGGGIVFLGRLSPQKRVHLLLEAVHAAGIPNPVTIIGDGSARPELEQQARMLGLTNVRFPGALPDAEVLEVLAHADVLGFVPRNEGLGLVAAEALMLGVPVVTTTDSGGVLDLVQEGEGGCVVAPTAAAIGAGLRRCLTDISLRVSAAQVGNRLRQELNQDAIGQQFEQVYARVLD